MFYLQFKFNFIKFLLMISFSILFWFSLSPSLSSFAHQSECCEQLMTEPKRCNAQGIYSIEAYLSLHSNHISTDIEENTNHKFGME